MKSSRQIIKQILRDTPLYRPIRSFYDSRQLKKWKSTGRPVPPPHAAKQENILNLAKEHKLDILVETGTFQGDMIYAMKDGFRQLYTIELSEDFYNEARKRFARYPHIHCIQGDSALRLPELLKELSAPALFWLDGHYSSGRTAKTVEETPIVEEIKHLHQYGIEGNVIIIDDARNFENDPSYPKLGEFTSHLKTLWPACEVSVSTDSIIIIPFAKNTNQP